jgi:hypothetical protein
LSGKEFLLIKKERTAFLVVLPRNLFESSFAIKNARSEARFVLRLLNFSFELTDAAALG